MPYIQVGDQIDGKDVSYWHMQYIERRNRVEQLESQKAELLEALGVIVTIFEHGGTIDEVGREATEAVRKFSA